MSSLHKRLDANEIRLLTIVSHEGVTAELDLRTYLRVEAPEYDVVSYAWGEDLATTSVSYNGFPLLIRTNLFKALPYLHESRPGPQRPLWIDAISLNQEDDIEKATHVPLMGVIYKQAARTLIWLGEASDDSDLAMEGISDLTQRMLDVTRAQCHEASSQAGDLKLVGLPDEINPIWKALRAIQLRPWYFRLWTLQEVFVANEAIVLCGTKRMPWDAVALLRQAAISRSLGSLVLPVAFNQLKMPEALHLMTTFLHGPRSQISNRNPMRLQKAILFSMNQQFKEPVDRIWALLALLEERDRDLLVKANLIQYSPAARLDCPQTYLGIMRLYIKQDPIHAMSLFEDGLSHVHDFNLPTWCPNWQSAFKTEPFSYQEEPRAFKAGFPETPPTIHSTGILPSIPLLPIMNIDDGLIFRIPGYVLEIVQVTTINTGIFWMSYIKGDGNFKEAVADVARIAQSFTWLRECFGLIKATRRPDRYAETNDEIDPTTPGPQSERVPDPGLHFHKNMKDYTKQLKVLLGAEEDLPGANGDIDFQIFCSGRKLFATKDGRFGLGPCDLEEGDLVCALYAGRPLFVLRPADSQGEPLQRYKVIGDAYISGLMQGEGFQGKQLDDMEEFCLI